MTDTGRWDQCRIDQRASAYHHAKSIELTRDDLEQGAVQTTADKFGAEADKGGALGRRFGCGEAAEAAKAGAIVERFGQAHIRKIVPRRQK